MKTKKYNRDADMRRISRENQLSTGLKTFSRRFSSKKDFKRNPKHKESLLV